MSTTKEMHHTLKLFSMKRGGCFGSCPIYEVIVKGDGKVEWNGEMFVEHEGKRTWQTTSRRMTAIAKAIGKVDFFNIKWEDIGWMSCSPSALMTVEFTDGRKRTINHEHGDMGSPHELFKLENTIDRLLGTAEYIGNGRRQP